MISKECFTQEWVGNVSQQLHYPDKNLIEKVIRAFALIDMLASSGCHPLFPLRRYNSGTRSS